MLQFAPPKHTAYTLHSKYFVHTFYALSMRALEKLQTVNSLLSVHPTMCVTALATILILPLFVMTVFGHRTAEFAFASPTSCVNRLVWFPGLQKQGSNNYSISFRRQAAGILAREICATPTAAPQPNTTQKIHFSLLGNPMIKQSISVASKEYPKVSTKLLQASPISASVPLVLPLERTDGVFEYRVRISDKNVLCTKEQLKLVCPIESLGLEQGQSYELNVERLFSGNVTEEVFAGTIITAEPVVIAESSIANNSIVYSQPTYLKLITNKAIKSVGQVVFMQGDKILPTSTTINDKEVTISFSETLVREVEYVLRIEKITAEDGGELNAPFGLQFQTSGGPKVRTINIGRYRVVATQTIELTFDQNLAEQNIANFIQMSGVNARYWVSGNKVFIDPEAVLPRCYSFTVTVKAGILSAYGLAGTSPWTYNSRTTCATVTTIGMSVRGRAILAYSFGSGASKVVFVGAVHGTERSTKYALDAWIDELEANPGQIPGHRTLIIIPTMNPDGIVAGSRTSANNVDLNRNFPTSNWQSGVYMPGPVYLPQGGGNAALSEPESVSIASFIQQVQPRAVLTYHADAYLISANGAGDSSALSALYSSKSRYPNSTGGSDEDLFGYPTTGSMEEWLYEIGITGVLVELGGNNTNEFNRNRDALWAIATLP